ncbi:NADH-quinone oxidoreductase subunit C [Dysgonomonas sp. PFB1-18]|uniref:NADH-quinone oxidoreductase subunit C n=1 Tax=unclassified Dysgonomonas TaxID=2630389 RepID=UPI002476F86D|nr:MULTISPECIES: NADH-quinone oxidoreductase subunit C [unclassified Dysgonomonas]MDH6307915.1 NADH-quinone oxidoreductase subunit C [Dysgonomonas sp. PF1-14]MDH6337833.1 NADH-quinone oxidoreductase subunit C [Dysgonomonas sp. PF1-16]MDH6379057.1 NADH-quinone oxidoreductase subunit C [Dysgonomonas sp. PFB1-18]MDH6396692.1 NADH-quinone oxidoreductase subunit C [Dysgonomonas sp. PF1-23]
MALETTIIENKIGEKFGAEVLNFRMERDIFTFEATPAVIKDVIRFMRDDETLRFNFLTDLCGVHYPDNEKDNQFAVVYLLHNWIDNVRVRVKTFLNGAKPEVDTVTGVFDAANWMERETYDFYGIIFKGHPNLKRILNDEGMVSFPMRKDYPLEDSGRTDKDDRFFGRTPNNYEPTK